MLSALPVLIGLQFLLGFLNYDVANVPSRPISRFLPFNPARASRQLLPEDGARERAE
jgi:hypothetical protein